jgi:hypothetical protein
MLDIVFKAAVEEWVDFVVVGCGEGVWCENLTADL